ncbi:MAG: LamB/YcsF family protein [Planctomycetia bacterium]|nr:LamB/YcsF family protein [Planctomycetia bacterium]
MRIDLNCDLGEGAGHDAEIMPLVTSATIACGAHAGDAASMAATVALARQHGVAIGAHPGHADRGHFGRREIAMGSAEAAALVTAQIARLAEIAGSMLHHVKLHGGLYHQVSRDALLADAVSLAIAARWPHLVVYAFSGSALADRARAAGLAVAQEAFIDRAYAADGSLVPRSRSGSTIDDPGEAAARAVALATRGCVRAIDGSDILVTADTLCIHGDGRDPVATASAVRAALASAGVVVTAGR